MKKQRLKIEDRLLIQELLKMNYNLKSIARAIDQLEINNMLRTTTLKASLEQ